MSALADGKVLVGATDGKLMANEVMAYVRKIAPVRLAGGRIAFSSAGTSPGRTRFNGLSENRAKHNGGTMADTTQGENHNPKLDQNPGSNTSRIPRTGSPATSP